MYSGSQASHSREVVSMPMGLSRFMQQHQVHPRQQRDNPITIHQALIHHWRKVPSANRKLLETSIGRLAGGSA